MRYRSIALSGGGMKGGAYVGAFRAIQEIQGSLEFPDGIYGSSAGAVIGGLLAFNVPVDTIHAVLKKHVYLSRWFTVFPNGLRRGLCSIDGLRTMIVELYKDAGVLSIETARIGDTPQPFVVVSSNMTARKPTLLMGDVPLLQALLCSSCIPGLFEPQVLYGQMYLDAAVYVRQIETIAPRNALVIQLVPVGDTITQQSSLSEILHACYMGTTAGPRHRNVCPIYNLHIGVVDTVDDAKWKEMVTEGYSHVVAFLTKVRAKKAK